MKKPPPKMLRFDAEDGKPAHQPMLTMSDIRVIKPKKKTYHAPKIKTLREHTGPRKLKRAVAVPSKYLIGFAAIMTLLFGFYAVRAIGLKKLADNSASQIYTDLTEAKTALKNFDPDAAHTSFTKINNNVSALYTEADRFGLLDIAEFGGSFIDILRRVPTTLKNILSISESAVAISQEAAYLKAHALELILNKKGPELISRLKNIESKINALPEKISSLQTNTNNFKEILGSNLLTTQISLEQGSQFLDALITWLESPYERHIAVLFENPSEIRPGGGFIGSFADVAIQQASLNHIKINDIYDPDGQLESNIIPPEPLQLITKRWGARDSNWFADFPTSANKTLSFLNQSKIYQEQETTFEGVIALNVHVIADLFRIVGPIELPEYNLVLDADSFLGEVQREVETGADKADGEPKRILKVLAPKLIEKIATMSDQQKNELIDVISRRANTRDIRLYLNDLVLKEYIKRFNIAGDLYVLPTEPITDYLSVVNANIAGGKTDAVIEQDINLVSTISLEGVITNTLTVKRTHNGDEETDSWYRVTNKNYLQILAPKDSKPLTLSGRSKWPDQPTLDYAGFSTDRDVSAMEANVMFDKQLGIDILPITNSISSFAFWFNTERGRTNTLAITYEHPKQLKLSSQTSYRFVFEKQAGVHTSLTIRLEAPPGFIWAESDSSTYELSTGNPDGRIVLDLTLAHLE